MATNSAFSHSTPTPLPVVEQTPSPTVIYTPLVSITPTTNPNATYTPIPENLIGSSVGQFPPDFTLINAVTNAEVNLRNYTGRFGGLTFPLLSDWEHSIARTYEVDTLPTNFFIRKNGKIWQVSSEALTEVELDTMINSLLQVP